MEFPATDNAEPTANEPKIDTLLVKETEPLTASPLLNENESLKTTGQLKVVKLVEEVLLNIIGPLTTL